MTDARTFQAAGETPVTLPPSDPPVDPVDPVDAVDAVDAVDPEATAKAVLEYARRLLTEGDFPGADERIEAAKQLSPTDKDPWYLSGRSLLSQGNPEGALAAFEQGLALAPSDVFDPINDDLTEWQITAFRSLGRFDEASAIIEPLLERGCDNVRLINEAGWLAFDKKDVREAFAFFADSLTIDAANADAARMASNILRDYGRLSSARKTLHAALDSGADSSLWQELGDLAFLDKRYEEAAAAYEKLGPAGAKNRRRAKRMSLHLPPIRALRRRIEGRSEAAFTALEPRLERVDGELDTEERRREVRRAVADQWRQRTAAMALSDVINTVLAWLYVALGLGIAFAVAKILYHRNAFNFSIVEWGAVSLLYAAVIAVSMALLCLPVICLNDN